MNSQWHPQRDYQSFHLVRHRENAKSPWDIEFYVSPGKTWPRRFRDLASAEAFAENLNTKASEAKP